MEIYHYKKPDISKRKVVDIGLTHIVTARAGLYNENLTVEEIALLRNLIWDCKKYFGEKLPREFISFIHSWMFTNSKTPVTYTDIVNDIENGVVFREGEE